MTAVTERSIDKDKLDCIFSSSSTIRCNYLSCALLLSYNYFILWHTCSLFNKILKIISFSWYYSSDVLKAEWYFACFFTSFITFISSFECLLLLYAEELITYLMIKNLLISFFHSWLTFLNLTLWTYLFCLIFNLSSFILLIDALLIICLLNKCWCWFYLHWCSQD